MTHGDSLRPGRTDSLTVAARHRWASAIGFRGQEFLTFGTEYFGDDNRQTLLFAAAGFDPRSPLLAERIASWAASRLTAVLIREERPEAAPNLRDLADMHERRLLTALPNALVEAVAMFDETDMAVIGGRRAAAIAANANLDGITDIVVDISAMSVGTSFPLVAALIERVRPLGCNLHAVVVSDPVLDEAIRPQPTESVTAVHGFRGELGLDHTAEAARLWLPQLASGRRGLLDRVFREIAPHDICPIVPFPAQHPRAGDELIDEYRPDLVGAWEIDTRNIIYAAEDDPLDVYRTILDLDDARQMVFDGHGGSLCILTPVGSKVLALGVLMAALERNFPVRHVEAVGFAAQSVLLDNYSPDRAVFAHVWLSGDPYPRHE